jgi:hypothetical protein
VLKSDKASFAADILRDLELNGGSLIIENVTEKKKLGRFHCSRKNPIGR